MIRKALVACGIVASVLYAAITVIVAMQWEAYSSTSQTVSELSAIDAPTRSLWVGLAMPYTLLMAAFGWGVWLSARRNRPLRVTGGVLVAYGLLGLFWPPMHLREVLAAGGATLTDTMHLVFAAVTVVLMLVAMGFGGASFGRLFRLYSIATIAVLAVFGALTGANAPRVEANLPTPLAGVWERINIGVFLLWVVVLALAILRTDEDAVGRTITTGASSPQLPRPLASSGGRRASS